MVIYLPISSKCKKIGEKLCKVFVKCEFHKQDRNIPMKKFSSSGYTSKSFGQCVKVGGQLSIINHSLEDVKALQVWFPCTLCVAY